MLVGKWICIIFPFLVCLGASGDIAKCLELAQETPKLSRRSGHQLERFLLRRAHQMMDHHCAQVDQEYCLLLAYELLYLWNALGACLKHSHAAIQIGKSIITFCFPSGQSACNTGLKRPTFTSSSSENFVLPYQRLIGHSGPWSASSQLRAGPQILHHPELACIFSKKIDWHHGAWEWVHCGS